MKPSQNNEASPKPTRATIVSQLNDDMSALNSLLSDQTHLKDPLPGKLVTKVEVGVDESVTFRVNRSYWLGLPASSSSDLWSTMESDAWGVLHRFDKWPQKGATIRLVDDGTSNLMKSEVLHVRPTIPGATVAPEPVSNPGSESEARRAETAEILADEKTINRNLGIEVLKSFEIDNEGTGPFRYYVDGPTWDAMSDAQRKSLRDTLDKESSRIFRKFHGGKIHFPDPDDVLVFQVWYSGGGSVGMDYIVFIPQDQ